MFPQEIYHFVYLLGTSLASFMICQKLNMSLSLGYLLSGVETLSQVVGLLIFLFTVGLEIELSSVNMGQTLFKELKVAFLNGALFAFVLGGGVLIWSGDWLLAIVLFFPVIFNMLWAGLAGFFLPFIILRLGYDPALSAGPLLTTTTDIFGCVAFFGLAKWLMNL